jgi:hypothetical protein
MLVAKGCWLLETEEHHTVPSLIIWTVDPLVGAVSCGSNSPLAGFNGSTVASCEAAFSDCAYRLAIARGVVAAAAVMVKAALLGEPVGDNVDRRVRLFEALPRLPACSVA